MEQYSWEEISKHNTEESLWIVVNDKVYDVTGFLKKHPGGMNPLKYFAGKDATDKFKTIAGHRISEILPDILKKLCVGEVKKDN